MTTLFCIATPQVRVLVFIIGLALLIAPAVSAQGPDVSPGGCIAGSSPGGPDFVFNGDFAIGAGPGPGIDPAAGFTIGGNIYNAGDGNYPPDTSIAIQSGPINMFGGVAVTDPFPGDPAYGISGVNTYLYVNGNNTGGPYIFWQQNITGLEENTTYNLFAYVNNIVVPASAAPIDPIPEFMVNGVPTGIQFPVPEVPDEWVRIQLTFTTGPGQTSLTLALRNNAGGTFGDDLALTYIGMQECVLDTIPEPGISVQKTVSPRRANPGDTVTYTYVVTNTGNVTLNAVTLNDDRLGTITLPVASLDPGQSVTVTVDYTIQPGDLPLTNVATVGGTPPAGGSVSASSSATVRPPNASAPDDPPASPGGGVVAAPALQIVDPFITKSVNPPFAVPGESVTWTITISNPGSIAVNNVQMQDTMPAEVAIQNVSATAGSASFSAQTVSFSIGTLAPGQGVTITINTRVRDDAALPFVITNRACTTSSEIPDARCAQATLTSAVRLPATGQSPWSPWRLPVFVLAALLLGGGVISVWRMRPAKV